jgi:7-carboxy-7-deazaguanine synthase
VRVVEVFGPTVQGEGPHAGRVCHFIRFGGCDYRCSWCDTPYAVDPAAVREAENLTAGEALERLAELAPAPMLVISGGNPALQKLEEFVEEAIGRYERVALETQGSLWRPWITFVDSLVVSPKPPSSGEATARNWTRFEGFMHQTQLKPGRVLKIVVFDWEDLGWALGVHRLYPDVPLYLSAGTDQDADDVREAVAGRYGWLCEAVIAEPSLHDVVVLPQLHVIAWGSRVGV